MRQLRVLIADDHAMIREGLRVLLNAQHDLEVIGEVSNGNDAYAQARALKPDVVVMDVSMPHLNGAQATQRLQLACPDIKILALSAYEDEVYVRQLLSQGASGYVLKRTATEELVQAIRAVAEGGIYLDPAIAGKLADSLLQRHATGTSTERLSEREIEVLRLIARGHSNRECADKLSLSIKTVETYKARVCEKLNLTSRADIVRYAIAQGWFQDQFQEN